MFLHHVRCFFFIRLCYNVLQPVFDYYYNYDVWQCTFMAVTIREADNDNVFKHLGEHDLISHT